MITIRDVAKKASVSIATVSKVINGYPDVGRKTRQKVLDVIEEMKFHPNTVARGLVKGKSRSIGIFLTTGMASQPFFSYVMGGMEQALHTHGYDLYYLAQIGWNRNLSVVQHCMSRNVDGVVAFGFQRNDLEFHELIEAEIPAVFIDLDLMGKRAGYITSDNRKAIGQGMEYLIQCGHQRTAYISGALTNFVGKMRYEGYRIALQQHGLPYVTELVEISDFNRESGYVSMQKLLALKERPTAVLCCSDMCAIGAIQAIRDAGLDVPKDISVVGFDDLPMTELLNPPLTTIRQNKEEIGKAAIEHLAAMIADSNYAPPAIEIETSLVVRDSCAKI